MASTIYDPKKIESKWSEKWEEEGVYKTDDKSNKKKAYVLGMFPYPSGEGLHTGHVRIFTAVDVMGRYLRMRGYEVLQPMGWDAFGLPAENAAIKRKTNPMKMVPVNEENFKRQLKEMGEGYDWERAFSTTDPDYYKWTQWLFLKLYSIKNDKGERLIYRKEVPINWCPFCKTGLANEEVLGDGTHERCGNKVEQRNLPQWVMRITDYAERLLADLDGVVWKDEEGKGRKGLDWPRGILEMQRNWIGKSKGLEIEFEIEGLKKKVAVWTKFWETVFGVTFVVVAPEKVKEWTEGGYKASEEVKRYVETSLTKTEQLRLEGAGEKTGVDTGLTATNPVNGEKVPVWVADYVLADVGTGVVMGVPAHDERDGTFARKYGLPIRPVVIKQEEKARSFLMGAAEISNEELLSVGAEVVRESEKGNRLLRLDKTKLSEYEELIAKKLTPGFWNEYLGEEIVFIFKEKSGEVKRMVLSSATEEEIGKMGCAFIDQPYEPGVVWKWLMENEWYREVVLAEEGGVLVNSGEFEGMNAWEEGKKKMAEWMMAKGFANWRTVYHLRDWIFSRQRYWGEPFPLVYCSKCGDENGVVTIPEEQLPVRLPELESYEPSGTGESPLGAASEWVKTRCPVCGGEARRETDTMPNWAGSCWYFLRFADPKNTEEAWSEEAMKRWLPVDWYLGGAEHAVLHLLYARFWVKAFYDLGLLKFEEPFLRLRSVGMVLAEDGKKMSKSLGNIVSPDEVVEKFGADAVRLYELFMGPWDQAISWDTRALIGCYRFMEKLWKLCGQKLAASSDPALVASLEQMIKKVEKDIPLQKFNTSVAALMSFSNQWKESKVGLGKGDLGRLMQVIAPLAPFLAEEVWREMLGEKVSVHRSSWPEVGEIAEGIVKMVIQVNGRVRGVVEMEGGEAKMEEKVVEVAKAVVGVSKWLKGGEKVVFVPGRVVNFVG